MKDTLDSGVIMERLLDMMNEVLRRLKEKGFKTFRRVVLTVRFADFTTRTRSKALPVPTDKAVLLKQEMLKMLLPFFDRRDNPQKRLIRLVGIRVEELV